MFSFYQLPSTVVDHPKYKDLKAAYSFYNVATTVSLKELMNDALIIAKRVINHLFCNFLMYNITYLESIISNNYILVI